MSHNIEHITDMLLAQSNPKYKYGATRFFKEPISLLGVRTPLVRTIAKQQYPRTLSKKEIFSLCEELLEKKIFEHTLIAFDWAYRWKHTYTKADVKRFTTWISLYVTNWAFCDDFCTHTYGAAIHTHKEFLPKLFAWTKSTNRWERRAAAVTLIYMIKKRDNTVLQSVYATADALLLDTDDLVQKGYGWMLKVASTVWPKDIYTFIRERKDCMPRTALRYALEKYPQDMRKEAMKKHYETQ